MLVTLGVMLAIDPLAYLTAAPPVESSSGPSPAAVRTVETRRKALAQFEGVDLDRMRPDERAAVLGNMGPALTDLAAALASDDVHIYTSAVSDLTNSHYRAFPKDPLRDVLLPVLKTPETASRERMVSQSFVMEYLASRYGPKAKAALPDLLKMVVDDKLPSYLRGQAIDAVAKIGPGDEAVIKAFIAAIENPIPKSESGVQDRAARHLGEMGKAAVAGKDVLRKLFERGSWNEDPALEALGKIGKDEPAKPLREYLEVLSTLRTASAKTTLDQAAVAFHHVVAAAKTGKKHVVGRPPREEEIIDADVAKAARPVLLAIVEQGRSDAYFRAASRALTAMGPGASPRAAKAFADVLVRTGASEAVDALERLETMDAEAVIPLMEAFAKSAAEQRSWHISYHLARTLARYGKAAKPAVPEVVRALRGFRASPTVADAYAEQFAAFLSVLAVAGGDSADARKVIVELLDPASDVMKRSAPHATAEYHMHLLLTLGKLGLPKEGELRGAMFARLQEGLTSDVLPVFSAAASVIAMVQPLDAKEAERVVPLLARTLAPKFTFKNAHEGLRHRFPVPMPADGRFGQLPALRALASLGSAAREALPAVKAIANETLAAHPSSFLPEPPRNLVIREARKTLAAIE
jgi:hypothetical protein